MSDTTDPQTARAALIAYAATTRTVTVDGLDPLIDAVIAEAAPADVDTVASRAAQVITSMGADIRALTGQRDRYRSAWCSARERAQAYGEGILRVVKDRESYQEWLRQAEELAAAPSAPSAPADRAGLLDAAAQAIRDSNGSPEALEWWRTHPQLIPAHVYAAAVLSVLPSAADRAASYRLAADAIESMQGYPHLILPEEIVAALRLLAAGEQPEPGSPAYTRRLADEERVEQQAQANLDQLADGLAAAIASCPGRELDPNPCRCPCYGCKHHCGAHDPGRVGGEEQPRFVRVCIACPECDHTLDENGACANGCHVPPAAVAEPGKENSRG